MTITQKVESGEDLKNLQKHPDIHNLAKIKLSDLDDDLLYLVKKYVGFYKPKNESGIFILDIKEVNTIGAMF